MTDRSAEFYGEVNKDEKPFKWTYKRGPLIRLGEPESCPVCFHEWVWPYPTPDNFSCPNCKIEIHNKNI